MTQRKTILVAPLHWGLGHATRCIPIIHALLHQHFDVILASDGAALLLLQKEFPNLESIVLPSYHISYPKKGRNFTWTMLANIPYLLRAIASEKKIAEVLVSGGLIDGIISDNRLGVRSKKIPSVFITHQLSVLSGRTTKVTSSLHQHIIKKFDQCWVPDAEDAPNLSGKLGHLEKHSLPIKYIGPVSRMSKKDLPKKYDILILLSGPEPQRTLLEEKMMSVFSEDQRKILFVQGRIEALEIRKQMGNMTLVNFLQTEALEEAINASDLVISRSGYTTIMDLAALEKDAFFIPTPGQFEQVYLAKKLKTSGLVPSCNQDDFSLEKLNEIPLFKGLKSVRAEQDFSSLFSLFQGE